MLQPAKKLLPAWTLADPCQTGHTERGFKKSVWSLANWCSWAGWCVTKQSRRAVIPLRLWAKSNPCTVPPSPLGHCSWLIKSQCDTSKGKTQHHAEINKPRHLTQDTWAKSVPLLTTRNVSAVFIFCYCFKTPTSQGTNGKKTPWDLFALDPVQVKTMKTVHN